MSSGSSSSSPVRSALAFLGFLGDLLMDLRFLPEAEAGNTEVHNAAVVARSLGCQCDTEMPTGRTLTEIVVRLAQPLAGELRACRTLLLYITLRLTLAKVNWCRVPVPVPVP